MPESQVWIDSTDNGLTLTLRLPLNRLEFAFGQPLAEAPSLVLARHAQSLSRYLLSHVGVRSGMTGWVVHRPDLAVRGSDGAAELEAVLRVQAPPGADRRRFSLLYDVVTHEVRTHRATVLLRNDWAAGKVGDAPRPLGEFTSQTAMLDVTLDAPAFTSSVRKLFLLGAHHIAEGTDHLMFLLTLLLVAPVAVTDGRWAITRSPRQALVRITAVVTAFTSGHTLTLALGSTGVLVMPIQAVEVAVALSIGCAAWHAIRPWVPHGELWIAAAFGLLHGLAFSASLSGVGLTVAQHAQALLAFNLGIEAVQLAVVAAIVPALLALARWAPGGYRRLRIGAGTLAMLASVAWTVDRLIPG